LVFRFFGVAAGLATVVFFFFIDLFLPANLNDCIALHAPRAGMLVPQYDARQMKACP
jgi:hypothetical protein